MQKGETDSPFLNYFERHLSLFSQTDNAEITQEMVYETLVNTFDEGDFFGDLNIICGLANLRDNDNGEIPFLIMKIRAEIQIHLPRYQLLSRLKSRLKLALESKESADIVVYEDLIELARLIHLAITQPKLH
ncbi:MAG TPA: hypothetical protein VF209_03855 [Patescibacteria group bacterium]